MYKATYYMVSKMNSFSNRKHKNKNGLWLILQYH